MAPFCVSVACFFIPVKRDEGVFMKAAIYAKLLLTEAD